MKLSRMALLAMAGAALSCGGDEAGIREGSSSILADSAVLAQMRDTGTVGRILYDPPPDLSLASAQQRRPDIFRAPTPAARPAAPKDTAKAAQDTTRRARRP